jgi:hypothetical protein
MMKKYDEFINNLAVIMLYNKHIVDQQYEAADKLKSLILISH